MAFTYFFRDLQTLEFICEHALPVLRTRRYIDIWDAGCAMGPEPYTLALLLRERMGNMYFRNVKIKATDLDGSNLFGKIISEGIYPREQVERIPKEIFDRYFVKAEKDDHYQFVDEIRKALSFQKHDLTSLEPVGSNFGIILCKNVLLHLSEQQRIDVLKMFHRSLMDGGFFATEQTQKLPEQVKDLFEPVVSNAQLFRKVN
jgi:chemotaxis protein methyltransferase CheR